MKDDFINRLLETGATESSSSNICSNRMEENRVNTSSQLTQTLYNLVAATDDLRCLKNELYPTVLRTGLDKGMTSTAIGCQLLSWPLEHISKVLYGIAFFSRFVRSASAE